MTPHRRLTRAALLAGAAALGALGLAACGGATNPPSSTLSPNTTTAPPAGTGGKTTTSTPNPGATTTTLATANPGSVSPSRCQVSQLSATAGGSNGATGHLGQVITFKNTSPSTCTLDGYPGLEMLGASGQAINTNVLRTPSVVVQAETPTLVTLASGQRGSFLLGYADQTGFGSSTCPASVKLEITPPNDFTHLVVPDQISAYGPSVGQCGAINVSPVYPGTGGQP